MFKKDVVLNNCRVVTHRSIDNGATEAFMADGGEMSETEWEEYCAAIRKKS